MIAFIFLHIEIESDANKNIFVIFQIKNLTRLTILVIDKKTWSENNGPNRACSQLIVRAPKCRPLELHAT